MISMSYGQPEKAPATELDSAAKGCPANALAGNFAAVWREWRRDWRWQQRRAQARRDRDRLVRRQAERERLALIEDVKELVQSDIVTDLETAKQLLKLLEMPRL
jgi:hypothetical protein